MRGLDTFLAEFKDGFQHNNRFACRVVPNATMLEGLEPDLQEGNRWLQAGFLCEATSLPDRSFAERELTLYGVTEQIPVHTQFTSLDCTFLMPVREAGVIRSPVLSLFHLWQNHIQNFSKGYTEDSRDFLFPEHYYGEIFLGALDRQNRPTIVYHFEKVYPRLLNATPMTWAEESEYARLQVGFTYATWHVIDDPMFFADAIPGRTPNGEPFMNSGPVPPQRGTYNPYPNYPGRIRVPGMPGGRGFEITVSTRIGDFTVSF